MAVGDIIASQVVAGLPFFPCGPCAGCPADSQRVQLVFSGIEECQPGAGVPNGAYTLNNAGPGDWEAFSQGGTGFDTFNLTFICQGGMWQVQILGDTLNAQVFCENQDAGTPTADNIGTCLSGGDCVNVSAPCGLFGGTVTWSAIP